jgi:hypothetical protein
MNRSLIQPVLSRQQLRDCNAAFIVGTGEMARYARSQLAPQYRDGVTFIDRSLESASFDGRPRIGFRQFCANAQPQEPILYATEDTLLLGALVAAGQRSIVDVREFFASCCHARHTLSPAEARLAVVSTVPRSGTNRIRYFLFALNEIRRGSPTCIDARQLFLYQTQGWGSLQSRYRLTRVLEFLNVDIARIGHYVPPGAMAALSANETFEALQRQKLERFARACVTNPYLAGISFPIRPLRIEPDLPTHKTYKIRYAFVARDIIPQIISMLSIYELGRLQLRARGAQGWSLHEYVRRCYGHFRPFVFSALDGVIPLILQKSISQSRSFVDVVVEDGYLVSMIADFALQTYACEHFEDGCSPNLQARSYSYDLMVDDPLRFFERLVTFLRNDSLDAREQLQIEQACALTSRERVIEMERQLGHALSHSDRVTNLLNLDSHITDSESIAPEVRDARLIVSARIWAEERFVRERLAAILSSMKTGARVANDISLGLSTRTTLSL